jgi:putative phosphoribosyl transferase
MLFENREAAGRALARGLATYADREDVVVLGLPRGGVPVAYEVAEAIGAPLDVFVVRKLGVPGHPELAMGAIATGGVQVLNLEVVREFGLSNHALENVIAVERRELQRRERSYRGGLPARTVRGKTVILVDDGLATGSSMRAAVLAVRKLQPARIVVAVPVAPLSVFRDFRGIADGVVCAATPEPFVAVGGFYENFDQTTDEEVRELLSSSAGKAFVEGEVPETFPSGV